MKTDGQKETKQKDEWIETYPETNTKIDSPTKRWGRVEKRGLGR